MVGVDLHGGLCVLQSVFAVWSADVVGSLYCFCSSKDAVSGGNEALMGGVGSVCALQCAFRVDGCIPAQKIW